MNITELIEEAEWLKAHPYDPAALAFKIWKLLPLLVAVIKNQQRQIECALVALGCIKDPVLSLGSQSAARDAITLISAIAAELEDVKP